MAIQTPEHVWWSALRGREPQTRCWQKVFGFCVVIPDACPPSPPSTIRRLRGLRAASARRALERPEPTAVQLRGCRGSAACGGPFSGRKAEPRRLLRRRTTNNGVLALWFGLAAMSPLMTAASSSSASNCLRGSGVHHRYNRERVAVHFSRYDWPEPPPSSPPARARGRSEARAVARRGRPGC